MPNYGYGGTTASESATGSVSTLVPDELATFNWSGFKRRVSVTVTRGAPEGLKVLWNETEFSAVAGFDRMVHPGDTELSPRGLSAINTLAVSSGAALVYGSDFFIRGWE